MSPFLLRSGLSVSAAVAGCALLYRAYRRLQKAESNVLAISERLAAHETGLDFLSLQVEELRTLLASLAGVHTAPQASPGLHTGAAGGRGEVGSSISAGGKEAGGERPRDLEEDGMSEAMGYRTADEDDTEELPPPSAPFGQAQLEAEEPGTAEWACVGDCAPPQGAPSGSASGEEADGFVATGPASSGMGDAVGHLSAELGAADALYAERNFAGAKRVLEAAVRAAVGEPGSASLASALCEVKWRLARVLKELADADKAAAAQLGGKEKERAKEREKAMMREALSMSQEALQLDDDSFGAHKWFAICLSITSGYDGTKASIEQSFVVKEHFEAAVRLNPVDATSRHLLGLWFYEVAGLSWATRRVAAALFAAPPTGTFEEAYEHFHAAEELSPGFYLKNRLRLAQCCIARKDKKTAKSWLEKAVAMHAVSTEDEESLAEAKKLLSSL